MKKPKHCRLGALLSLLALLASAGSLQAGLIATNAAIPAAMTATGGTASDPSVYVFDNYAKDFVGTSITLGTAAGAKWIRLEIRNGATVTTTGAGNRIGSDLAAYTNSNCSVVVTGTGSSLTMAAGRLGGMSPNNSLIVNDSGTVNLMGYLTSGYNGTSVCTNNSVLIDDATVNVGTTRFRLGYADGHNYHTLVIRNGGLLSTTTGRIGIRYGKYCDFRVEGEGSMISIGSTSAGALILGENTTLPHHNTLTLVDGGVCKLTSATATLTIGVVVSEGGSGLRFAKGIFAVAGNRPTHVLPANAWLWDGDSWEQAPSGWVGTYYVDETAAAAAGRPGYGGYTVFTGGKSIADALKTTLVVIK